MKTDLPKRYRPDVKYKKFIPGIDFPSWLLSDLQAIDDKLFLVWHRYRVLWDSIINTDTGPLDDDRYTVNYDYGELNFGFVLTNGFGDPLTDGSWHVWRLSEPYGWTHVIKIEDQSPAYLRLLVSRLHKQAWWMGKYGSRSYTRLLSEMEGADRKKLQDDHEDLMACHHDENNWLVKKAMENLGRGDTQPTNPTKDIIVSYAGQTKRSKIVRPLTDKEGGIVTLGD